MKKSAVTALMVLFFALLPTRGQVNRAGHEIACPVPGVRTDITTPIPRPWWTTPQEGKLSSVGIQVIGGEKTLVCRYSAYATQVSVMRKFPEGVSSCAAAGNHFVCR